MRTANSVRDEAVRASTRFAEVGAGDEQHERGKALQERKRRPQKAEHVISHRHDQEGSTSLCIGALAQIVSDRFGFCPGGLEARALAEPREHRAVGVSPGCS